MQLVISFAVQQYPSFSSLFFRVLCSSRLLLVYLLHQLTRFSSHPRLRSHGTYAVVGDIIVFNES